MSSSNLSFNRQCLSLLGRTQCARSARSQSGHPVSSAGPSACCQPARQIRAPTKPQISVLAQNPARMREDIRDTHHVHRALSAGKQRLSLLGTGWRRFRFRLGSPRAEAHVWGKGAHIPQRSIEYHKTHLAAPAKIIRRNTPRDHRRLASQERDCLPPAPALHSFRRAESAKMSVCKANG